jgi:glycyl-tRNA synthetase
MFLTSIGIRPEHCRFRQHLPTEMAHYAADCWDAEIETSLGWLECVGIADRACFDLNAHAEATKVDLMFRETLDKPVEVEVARLTKPAGIAAMKAFKKQGRAVLEWMQALPQNDLLSLVNDVKANGSAKRNVSLADGDLECVFEPPMVEVETKKEKQTTIQFMPGVVEPSFGIDRIFFSCIEHSYYARPKEAGDDAKQIRGVLKFPAAISPYKMTILPVDQRIPREEAYPELMKKIRDSVSSRGHSCTLDDSNATIGKRYSRNDELGIPFACTIDFDSFKDGTVTLRERDSMVQLRMPADDVGLIVHNMCWGRRTWEDYQAKYS